MTHLLRLALCILLLSQLTRVQAQITITSPVPRMVFQRDLNNEARVTITGAAPSGTTLVEARFVPLAIGQGNVTAWTSLSFLSGTSSFRGAVSVSAGWYRLTVRAKNGATILAQTQIDRVGVGEVFVVAGQSNFYGGLQRVSSASEDRVVCLDSRQDSISTQLLPLQFSHINYGTSIGPSQPPHLWGSLGDKLVQRLNVPVLFLGAALGGSSSTEWQQSAAGIIGTTQRSSVYRQLGEVLRHYVVRTGARAVLWHQGETDTFYGVDQQTYYNNLKYVIQKSRQQLSPGPLTWMISRVSYNNGATSPGIIAAQNQLIADLPNAFPGPATDSIIGTNNRPDNVHMLGEGLIRFTNALDQALSTQFFQNAVPFIPTDSSALITTTYTLPLTRRQGDTVAVASLRSDPHQSGNQYIAQLVRASDGAVVYESSPSTENPILVKLPTTLPDGQYRLRTRSTSPAIVGTLGEPFTVQQSVSAQKLLPVYHQPVRGGTTDAAIKRISYRYEPASHGFYAMVDATVPVEVRIQRIDGGSFDSSDWYLMPPGSQAPDYDEFAEFNYIRNYPPTLFGVGGVDPQGKYRYSVRRQGDTGSGVWFDLYFLGIRTILYQNEPISSIPPVLTLGDLPNSPTCLDSYINVYIDVSDGTMNPGNTFSVRLSDANGSFANETVIGTSSTSPISATILSSLPAGSNYRIRVVASDPAVASAPSSPVAICNWADLSMEMQLNNRTPLLGQPVTLTVVLTNSGPLSTSNVTVQSRLPTGMEFVDASTSGISAANNIVSINAGSLAMGTNAPFVLRLKPNQQGTFSVSAQITASDRLDPDSQPNSGTGDGQDDAATVDLRTPDASGQLYVSPNPDQVPLPSVESNQPTADPAKADLSLLISASSITTPLNGTVTLTATINNRGGLAATNTKLQLVLPTGWQVTNTSGLTVNGQNVTVDAGTIAASNFYSVTIPVRVNSMATVMGQILSVSQPDPDSTPGNGYNNGEDDEAQVSIRLR